MFLGFGAVYLHPGGQCSGDRTSPRKKTLTPSSCSLLTTSGACRWWGAVVWSASDFPSDRPAAAREVAGLVSDSWRLVLPLGVLT